MARNNIEKLRLHHDFFNAEGMTDENSLASMLLLHPDKLSPVLTHLAGREDKRFPLTYLTEGMGYTKPMMNTEFDWQVINRLDKAVAIAISDYAAGDKPGLNHQRFTLRFAEKWFPKQYIIESPSNFQARVMDEPLQDSTGYWVYNLQLTSSEASHFLPVAETMAGQAWSTLFAPVATSGSRGNESYVVAPSSMRNQLTTYRKSYRYEGNMMNQVVNIELPVDGGTTKLWWDFEEYQHFMKMQYEKESLYWYGVYNRDKSGRIHLLDDNGKPIPIGAGVLEQIPNYDTYSELTETKISSIVRDTFFGASEAQNIRIRLFTGAGGREEFDSALKNSTIFTLVAGDAAEYFIGGDKNSYNLIFGGYFGTYRHIDGHTVEIVHNPLFDVGPRAMKSRKHPRTGLPLESYRMVFLDMSIYDGEANMVHTHRAGRALLRWAVSGSTVPKGFKGNDSRASDVDGASVHYLKTGGVTIRRSVNCFHLECNIA